MPSSVTWLTAMLHDNVTNHGQKTTAILYELVVHILASYSALTYTRHHTRRAPGVPGSAKRRMFNRGRDLVLALINVQ